MGSRSFCSLCINSPETSSLELFNVETDINKCKDSVKVSGNNIVEIAAEYVCKSSL